MCELKTKAYPIKSADGGRYIDGMPTLKWGAERDNSYGGCVTALLNAIGLPVAYHEVMGWSGVCYQAIMLDNWDPSSQMPQNGRLAEKNVGDAVGIAVYTLNDEHAMWEQAKQSIDHGVPVLLVGGRWAPEWSLACGYAVEHGKVKFFGRTYFDGLTEANPDRVIEHQAMRVPENEIYTANNYFYLSEFPGIYPVALTRFYDKNCEPISRKQALKASLQMCLAMFEQKPGEHHRFGYDAYDVLISGFELDDAAYQQKCGNDQYFIGSMQDARRAAYQYLHASAGLLDDDNKAGLTATANLYQAMLDNLQAAVPYDKTTAVFSVGKAQPVWNTPQRQQIVTALRANKVLERQARILVADILAQWEDS